jgi:hypothetical protein
MVTVMLVVVSVHHQVMSDVRTVTETETACSDCGGDGTTDCYELPKLL